MSAEFLDRISKLSPKRLALLALELQNKVERLEKARHEPLAVIGLGCRFPGARDPDEFWRLQRDGVDAISEVPKDRWDVDSLYDPDPDAPGKIATRFGGFLTEVDRFDPAFFGISPREALSMDPQQRLLLEVCWEALEDAAQSPEKLFGHRTGVFVGIASSDYPQLLAGTDPSVLDTYLSTGSAHSIASGRISYVLGLHGPSLSIDTACSSSLIAIHLACQSLRMGESRMALAGGVNLILSPDISIMLSRAHMMAPDGRCKTFAAAADGFVRGEGCGVVVLKRLGDALADGDRVLAVIRGSAANQDGRSSGITAPNGPAQEDVIRQALADASVAPADVQFVETHGTGTSLGDPIEVQALGAALRAGRTRPVAIGSVKTNVGHLEAAAGVAGLIRVVLALQHEEIPPHLHFQAPNPHIPWDELKVEVVTQRRPWPAALGPRLAAVSSFGFSGTNAHIVLEGAPVALPKKNDIERPLHLLVLSGRTENALREVAGRCERHLTAHPDVPWADVAFTAATGRSHLARRLAIPAASTAEAREKLARWQETGAAPGSVAGQARGSLEVAYLFTGQGAQYAGMGRALFLTQPTFRKALHRCDEILRPLLERPLLSILYPEGAGPEATSPLDETAYTQPALFALEYSLAELWRSWGIEPNVLMGHSVGEYVAACLAGVFSLEDGLRLIAERGRLMGALPRNGAMAAVLAGEERVRAAVAPRAARLSIAAVNGPENVVVSGEEASVDEVLRELEKEGIKSKRLTVSHAFHSPLMDPMLEAFAAVARTVSFSPPQIALVSNLTGTLVGGDDVARPEYWVRHVREAVRFSDGMHTLHAKGYRVFLEAGPAPTLLGMGRRCVPEENSTWLPSLRPGREDWGVMLESLGTLYAQGAAVDWVGFDRDYGRNKVALPTYPFERERYWHEGIGARRRASSARTTSGKGSGHPTDAWLYEAEWRLTPLEKAEGFPPVARISEEASQVLPRLAAENDLSSYDVLLPELDALCAAWFVKAFRQLGWTPRPGEQVTAQGLVARLAILPAHRRLVQRMLEVLGEERVARRVGDDSAWEVTSSPPEVDTVARLRALEERFPRSRAELGMAGRCGEGMAEVLRGDADALQLLFPGGSLDLAEQLYQEAPAARTFGGLMREALASALRGRRSSRPLRVLEIGGGTGATTAHVLPALPADRTRYVFTDVSRAFTSRAREKFRALPFLTYEVLDIEKDPAGQGFPPHTFDVVIAANVLHATKDLRTTLAHVRSLLAPGGLLVLQEVTELHRFDDVTVGLTEGWWRFSDVDLRPASALLSKSSWKKLLVEVGFAEAAVLPEGQASQGILAQQGVVLARVPAAEPAASSSASGTWLLFADREGVGRALADRLRAAGGTCVLVEHGGGGPGAIDPMRPDEFKRAVAEAGANLRGVVHLWALDCPEPEASTTDEVAAAQTLASRSVLHLVQALAQAAPQALSGLWIVTRGSQSGRGLDPSLLAVSQATAWGLGKVIALEHPELRCVRVDLAPGTDLHADALAAELLEGDGEDQVALRPSGRRATRLVRADPKAASLEDVAFRSDGSYLVTGGLSGLGLLVARFMVERGARHVVLMGRRDASAAARQTIDELQESGARVVVARGDVSREAELAAVLGRMGSEMPPLRGVVHSAGVLADGVLAQQDWERFARVLAPKVEGAWNLHRATRSLSLDFFVLFSSGAALLGSPGQGNHAAANAFLDALAHHRRAASLPALSINWGLWGEVGAAADRQLGGRLTLHGMEEMSPRDGLEALARVMRTTAPQIGVLAIDWARLGAHLPSLPFYSELRGAASGAGPVAKAVAAPDLRARLAEAPPSKRRSILHDHVAAVAARVLGLDPAKPMETDRPLQELGLDSLMAVELRNALGAPLGRTLPATLLFDHPTIEKLADHLGREVLGLEPLAREEPSAPEPAQVPAGDVLESLSDQEMANLLAEKLDLLESEGKAPR